MLKHSFVTFSAEVLWVLIFACANAQAGRVQGVPQWTRFEASFTSTSDYENPVQDVKMEVDFSSPSGRQITILGFWDGERNWKVRFSPEETGHWTYRTRSSRTEDGGLHNQAGEFTCMPYKGGNSLYRHGALGISNDKRYLVHADGTPFFWLSDTAWNGPLKADAQSWETYLRDRVSKGFTAIQFVTTQWISADSDAEGRTAFSGKDRIAIHPAFYQRLDKRIDAINEQGMLAAPVLIWDAPWYKDKNYFNPGFLLSNDQIVVLANYMVARYGGNQVVWILNGDGDYRGEKAARWREIGRAVFKYSPNRLATVHPAGPHWVYDEFRDEPWLSFMGYQSGHFDRPDYYLWHAAGPPAKEWTKEPVHPIINLEPNYEAVYAFETHRYFDDQAVRRAAYWSLLIGPPAGVAYGAHGIWSWELKRGIPLNFDAAGEAPSWKEAMHLPGSTSMKHLKDLFTSFDYWRLRPAQELLVEQPGAQDPLRYVVVARAEGADWGLAYLPVGRAIRLRAEALGNSVKARWFNPRTGKWSRSQQVGGSPMELRAPSAEDWVVHFATTGKGKSVTRRRTAMGSGSERMVPFLSSVRTGTKQDELLDGNGGPT